METYFLWSGNGQVKMEDHRFLRANGSAPSIASQYEINMVLGEISEPSAIHKDSCFKVIAADDPSI